MEPAPPRNILINAVQSALDDVEAAMNEDKRLDERHKRCEEEKEKLIEELTKAYNDPALCKEILAETKTAEEAAKKATKCEVQVDEGESSISYEVAVRRWRASLLKVAKILKKSSEFQPRAAVFEMLANSNIPKDGNYVRYWLTGFDQDHKPFDYREDREQKAAVGKDLQDVLDVLQNGGTKTRKNSTGREETLDDSNTLVNAIIEAVAAQGNDEAKATGTVECHVTLTQMAAIVSKSRRTLERLRNDGKLPTPAVKGGKGKADEWQWSDVQSILQDEYNRQMPEVFPTDRFIRR